MREICRAPLGKIGAAMWLSKRTGVGTLATLVGVVTLLAVATMSSATAAAGDTDYEGGEANPSPIPGSTAVISESADAASGWVAAAATASVAQPVPLPFTMVTNFIGSSASTAGGIERTFRVIEAGRYRGEVLFADIELDNGGYTFGPLGQPTQLSIGELRASIAIGGSRYYGGKATVSNPVALSTAHNVPAGATVRVGGEALAWVISNGGEAQHASARGRIVDIRLVRL